MRRSLSTRQRLRVLRMNSIVYVAYCLDCDAQLGESEVGTHECEESKGEAQAIIRQGEKE